MSVGFRIFALMLLGFGAVWVYRFRSVELDSWLRPGAGWRSTEASSSGLVDRIIGPSESARVLIADVLEAAPEPPLDPVLSPGREHAVGLGGQAYAADPDGVDLWNDPAALPADGEGWPGGDIRELSGIVVDATDPEFAVLEPDPARAPGASETRSGTPGDPATVLEPGDGDDVGGVDDGGATSRGHASAPPERAGDRREIVYRVAEGDSLWKLAKRFLGKGSRYREIVAANRDVIDDDGVVVAGTEIKILVPVSSERFKEDVAQDDIPVEESSAEQSSGSSPPAGEAEDDTPEVVLHRVERDENLTKIAKRYYPGDSQGWKRIFQSNQELLTSPDSIRQGMVLKVSLQQDG